ncbi:putative ribonuclease H-like domain-containing protein [Tanacetum coccineum]
MQAVPPHGQGFIASGPDVEIDDSKYTYGPEKTQPSEPDSQTNEVDACDSNISTETSELVFDTPVFATKHVKTPSENVKNNSTHSQKPKVNNKQLEKGITERACFVCGSLSHLIRDCDYHVKLAKQVKLHKQNMSKGNGSREKTNKILRKPIWDNAQRVNKQHQFVPLAVQTRTGTDPVNTVKASGTNYENQQNLKNKGIIDSGCSRHMTGNKAYLADYQDINGGPVAFGGSRGYITGKGKIQTGKLDFEDLPDENQILLKVPRQNNMYSFNLENIVPLGGLACLIAKATTDESNLWHRRLGHVNFKNLNRLVKGNLVRGLPTKLFQNDHTCVACQKGKQHKASCKAKFSWTFFLRTKDETSAILKDFIRQIENQLNQKVKTIRCDNGTEFKNRDIIEFCGLKGIKREYSNARTPQQNGVRERTGPLLRQQEPCLQIHFYLTLFGLKQLVLLAMFLTGSLWALYFFHKTPLLQNQMKKRCSPREEEQVFLDDLARLQRQGKKLIEEAEALTRILEQTLNIPVGTASANEGLSLSNTTNSQEDDYEIPPLEDIHEDATDGIFTHSSYDDEGAVADFTNLGNYCEIYVQKQRRPYHKDFHHCLFACFLSQHEPKKISEALEDESWVDAMQEELLQFEIQKGHRQEEGIDYDEVFAPVARLEAIRIFLAFASYKGLIVYQMDVKSAFLYGKIDEEVYVSQPPGFQDPKYPEKVYKVVKALYGLHQAPRAWYATLSTFLLKNGYRRGTIDKTLFLKKDKHDIILVQVYVDDIIFGSTKKSWCDEFEALMKSRFQMSSMGELTFFLGLQVKQNPNGIFISQDKYVAEILKKFDFASVKTASTPIETQKPLVKDEEASDVDVHLYRSMIGSLMYVTASRPDIMFAVCACSRFQVTPKTSHLSAVKRIFRYLKGKPKLGLWYPRESSFDLESYSDSDYAGANLDRKSTTGGCQFLGRRLITWQCKKQTIVATSTTEAEYVAAASCCGQVLWIQNQMLDYGFNFMNTKIYIDNESTICIVKNPVYHSKTKHIAIRHHFIRDAYEKKLIQVLKIHTNDNVADLLTKAFDVSRFQFLVVSIGMGKNSLVKHFEDMRLCRPSKEYFQVTLVSMSPKPIRIHLNRPITHAISSTDILDLQALISLTDDLSLLSNMAALESCPKHNMIAYLEKTKGNVEFPEVIDFLQRSYISHALTVSPVVSTTFVEQFWTSAKSKTINNVRHITAKVAGKLVSISEASIRTDLLFDDANGIDTLPNQAIFDAIQLMGYEGDLSVLTFNKALFSPQWRLSEEQPSPSPTPTSEAPNESLPNSSSAQPSEVPFEQQPDLSPSPSPSPSPQPSPTPIVPDSIPDILVSDQAKAVNCGTTHCSSNGCT